MVAGKYLNLPMRKVTRDSTKSLATLLSVWVEVWVLCWGPKRPGPETEAEWERARGDVPGHLYDPCPAYLTSFSPALDLEMQSTQH